jgi:hypothetical protein
MKKVILLLFLTLSLVLISSNVFAADGDLIVNGKVGIGTTTPAQKLSVAGTIESTSGGIKFPDGSIQTVAAGAADGKTHKTQIFTANGTWTKPTGVSSVFVTACGGGGGGSAKNTGTSTYKSGGGGGGAGQCLVKIPVNVTGDVAVTVGAGGATGVAGVSSSFGALITASGGGAGVVGTSGTGGQKGGNGGAGGAAMAAGGVGASASPYANPGTGSVIGGSGGAGGYSYATSVMLQ